MTWSHATIRTNRASIGTGLKVSLKKLRSKPATFGISVTGAAIRETGLVDGDGIEVMIGEGEHHGLIRLRKNKSTAQTTAIERKAVRGGKYLHIGLGHQPAFVDRAEPGLWCQWEKVEDGWVEIVLPKWADETGPKARKAGVVTREHQSEPPDQRTGPKVVVAHPAPQIPAKRNVTSALMGDPPPGRREMLAKFGEMKV